MVQTFVRLIDDLDDLGALLFCAASPRCLMLIFAAVVVSGATMLAGIAGFVVAVATCALPGALLLARSVLGFTGSRLEA